MEPIDSLKVSGCLPAVACQCWRCIIGLRSLRRWRLKLDLSLASYTHITPPVSQKRDKAQKAEEKSEKIRREAVMG